MDIGNLRAKIEPFLDFKGYKPNTSMRSNSRSYIKLMLDFMQAKDYSELNEAVIWEYLRSYEGTANFGVRKLRVQEFYEYVKGANQETMPQESEVITETMTEKSDMARSENENDGENQKSEANTEVKKPAEAEQPVTEGRRKKGERKQISVYLNVENYEQLQDISYFTGWEISKICESAILKLIESNQEQLRNAQELKNKISSMKFEI